MISTESAASELRVHQFLDLHQIDLKATRDLTSFAFDRNGRYRVRSASNWRETTKAERGLLAMRHAMYVLPTLELIDRIGELIAGRRAIEIGSGNGVLAAALGIPATDNHMQAMPRYRALYEQMRQPTICYGKNVERLDARTAIVRHKPQVVVAAWVTHRYDPRRPEAGGNEIGVDEDAVIDSVESYIFIGHSHVHRGKPIWSRPHSIEFPDYAFSRAMSDGRDFIAVWNRRGEQA